MKEQTNFVLPDLKPIFFFVVGFVPSSFVLNLNFSG